MTQNRKEWINQNQEKIISARQDSHILQNYAQTFYDARDLMNLHGTYAFEMQMLEYVKKGNVQKLKELLMEYPRSSGYQEGKVATDDLRQGKNIFVALVAMVGKMAAIPGGMPIEQAYYLIDTYSLQCEEKETLEEIYILQYNMLLDFTAQVERYHTDKELSPLIRDCVNYIISHLNEPIRAIDVIEYSGRSRSYLSERFKKETGIEIGTYITHRKIDEAKTLLRYTEKPIPEISAYLSFSSQPYFQNVFKKVTGVTPMKYRSRKEKQ